MDPTATTSEPVPVQQQSGTCTKPTRGAFRIRPRLQEKPRRKMETSCEKEAASRGVHHSRRVETPTQANLRLLAVIFDKPDWLTNGQLDTGPAYAAAFL